MSSIPKSWQPYLRDGARARLRGALDFDHASIPLDVNLRLRVEDAQRLSLHLVIPDAEPTERDADPVRLTPRERNVVALIGRGHATDEIARRLFITPATVRTHVRNAMAKAQVHTRAQLVARILAPNNHYMTPLGDDDGDGRD